jgi:transposase
MPPSAIPEFYQARHRRETCGPESGRCSRPTGPVGAAPFLSMTASGLQGILFVLYTGIAWRHLPLDLGFGSGVTCWRRHRRWTQAGVWDRLHRLLLFELHARGRIDWSAVCLDGSPPQR